MKRSRFDEASDQHAADNAGVAPSMMCRAHGCPNRWSTSDGHLCRWHADAEPEDWPRVTRDLDWEITEMARVRGTPQLAGPPYTAQEKRAILLRLRTVLTEVKDERVWLAVLRRRAASGERMSAAQKHALRECRYIETEGVKTAIPARNRATLEETSNA